MRTRQNCTNRVQHIHLHKRFESIEDLVLSTYQAIAIALRKIPRVCIVLYPKNFVNFNFEFIEITDY